MKNDYYVYFHRNSITNEIFYVGKGRRNRCNENGKKRSACWHEYLTKHGCNFTVEKVKENLTDCEARLVEKYYLDTLENIVNVKKDNEWHTNLLEISKYFEYSSESPTFLIWKTPLKYSNKKVGDVAGSPDNGYIKITLNYKQYLAHRLIWVIFNNKEIPEGMVINHKDCNPSNNSIDNLECVSFAENNRKKLHNVSDTVNSANTSGVNGVRISITKPSGVNGRSYENWEATFYNNDQLYKKSFSIRKYGYDEAYILACEWRKQMEELYYK